MSPRAGERPILTPIVTRALLHTVTNIGQLSRDEINQLERAIRHGILAKGKGGPYPALKTVYARFGFDFEQERREWVAYMMRLHELETSGRRIEALELMKAGPDSKETNA
jgi:hypothetical protein